MDNLFKFEIVLRNYLIFSNQVCQGLDCVDEINKHIQIHGKDNGKKFLTIRWIMENRRYDTNNIRRCSYPNQKEKKKKKRKIRS